MLILLAPSKTLDFDHAAPSWVPESEPIFIGDTRQIVEELTKKDIDQLAKLMHVSQAIAATNYARIKEWGSRKKAGLWAYRGDVYKGMYADQLTKNDADWAQRHLAIMSGLYGIVRPYDAISPYRLEMKTPLSIGRTKNLYEFWSTILAAYADTHSHGIICNLASDEYSRPVTRWSNSRIITPVFIDYRPNGKIGPAPIYNKMMRGVMAHWMIKNKIDDPNRLKEFTGHGYIYDATRSKPDAPAFIRAKMVPLVF